MVLRYMQPAALPPNRAGPFAYSCPPQVGNPNSLSFTLNGAPVTIANPDPRLTLLDWLRGVAGLTGTKSSCRQVKTLPFPCVSTAFVAKTVPFLAVSTAGREDAAHARWPCSTRTPAPARCVLSARVAHLPP